jgi:hypothetical protein
VKLLKLFGLFFLLSCHRPPRDGTNSYTVDLWNFNGSMAYSLSYHIHDDTLSVSFNDELENGKDVILLKKILDKDQKNNFCNYLSSFNIDTLKSEYVNHSAQDGDQKTISISIGTEKKSVYISNVYMKNIADLINKMNELIDSPKLKIRYTDYNFKPPR